MHKNKILLTFILFLLSHYSMAEMAANSTLRENRNKRRQNISASGLYSSGLSLFKTGHRLDVASWNLLNFGGGFGGTLKVIDATLLKIMAKLIGNYDIVFLQEIAEITKYPLRTYKKEDVCTLIKKDITENNFSKGQTRLCVLTNCAQCADSFTPSDCIKTVESISKFLTAFEIAKDTPSEMESLNSLDCKNIPSSSTPGLLGNVGAILESVGSSGLRTKVEKISEEDLLSNMPCVSSNFLCFRKLCDQFLNSAGLTSYICKSTGYVGNNEGYGVVYKKYLEREIGFGNAQWTANEITEPYIKQGLEQGEMFRPPMKFEMELKAGLTDENIKRLSVYNVHVKPTKKDDNATEREIRTMSDIISNFYNCLLKNVMVTGDFNADCAYYKQGFSNPSHLNDFHRTNWTQVIPDGERTNFAKRKCAYDRMVITIGLGLTLGKFLNSILSKYKYKIVGDYEYKGKNRPFIEIISTTLDGTSNALSDHRIISGEFNFGAISPVECDSNFVRKTLFKRGERVCFVGQNFVEQCGCVKPGDSPYKVYVVPLKKTLVDGANLLDSTKMTLVCPDCNGDMSSTFVGSFDVKGDYAIIIDIDNDKKFTRDIDVYEKFTVTEKSVQIDHGSESNKAMICNSNTVTAAISNHDLIYGMGCGSIGRNNLRENTEGIITVSVHADSDTAAHADILAKEYKRGREFLLDSQIGFDDEGKFERDLRVSCLEPGLYNMGVVVFNGAGESHEAIVDQCCNIAGFLVEDAKHKYNQIEFLDDNAKEGYRYKVDLSNNIYARIEGLDPDEEIQVYLLSLGKLAAKDRHIPRGTNLKDIAIPFPSRPDESQYKFCESSQSDRKCRLYAASKSGILFTAIWTNLSNYKNEDFIDTDGKEFVLVVDKNKSGKYDDGDIISQYPIDKILSWFASSHTVLDGKTQTEEERSVIKQYQEFMNSVFHLENEIEVNGEYGEETQIASEMHMGSRFLYPTMLDNLKTVANTGFEIVTNLKEVSTTHTDSKCLPEECSGEMSYGNNTYTGEGISCHCAESIIIKSNSTVTIDLTKKDNEGNNARTGVVIASTVGPLVLAAGVFTVDLIKKKVGEAANAAEEEFVSFVARVFRSEASSTEGASAEEMSLLAMEEPPAAQGAQVFTPVSRLGAFVDVVGSKLKAGRSFALKIRKIKTN